MSNNIPSFMYINGKNISKTGKILNELQTGMLSSDEAYKQFFIREPSIKERHLSPQFKLWIKQLFDKYQKPLSQRKRSGYKLGRSL